MTDAQHQTWLQLIETGTIGRIKQKVLGIIATNPGITLSEIAFKMEKQVHQISGRVSDLTKAGYIFTGNTTKRNGKTESKYYYEPSLEKRKILVQRIEKEALKKWAKKVHRYRNMIPDPVFQELKKIA